MTRKTQIKVTITNDTLRKMEFVERKPSFIVQEALDLYFAARAASLKPPLVKPNPYNKDPLCWSKPEVYKRDWVSDAMALDKYFKEYHALTGVYPPERAPNEDANSDEYLAWKKTKEAKPYLHLQRTHSWHPRNATE